MEPIVSRVTSHKQSTTYDSLNRIANAEETYNTSTQNWEQSFTYDRHGNRNFVEESQRARYGGRKECIRNFRLI